MDVRIVWACRDRLKGLPWAYSRYADDLVLSLGIDPRVYCTVDFVAEARRILMESLEERGWQEAPEKARVWWHAGSPLVLCGITVPAAADGFIGLPRETRRAVRSALRVLRGGGGDPRARGLVAWAWSVTGNLGYLAAISPPARRAVAALAEGLGVEAEGFTDAWLRFHPGGVEGRGGGDRAPPPR